MSYLFGSMVKLWFNQIIKVFCNINVWFYFRCQRELKGFFSENNINNNNNIEVELVIVVEYTFNNKVTAAMHRYRSINKTNENKNRVNLFLLAT